MRGVAHLFEPRSFDRGYLDNLFACGAPLHVTQGRAKATQPPKHRWRYIEVGSNLKLVVAANTRSEARARLKEALCLDLLPSHLRLERIEPAARRAVKGGR